MCHHLDLFRELYRAIKHEEIPTEELEAIKKRLERINAKSQDQGHDPPGPTQLKDPPAQLSDEE
jgi:hypothetical protein